MLEERVEFGTHLIDIWPASAKFQTRKQPLRLSFLLCTSALFFFGDLVAVTYPTLVSFPPTLSQGPFSPSNDPPSRSSACEMHLLLYWSGLVFHGIL
ncbi:hypothetical protein Nepgr_003416 [Nepenthes gracilis]|uniref:Uncharacterized protein n=1 Tax=Nepenthes gracilis TaxID=150966 RepID=A0AAD3RZK9_NEPGR|nr:hypothetical protein Nepgr_003416 [Nepenthes gracilis]